MYAKPAQQTEFFGLPHFLQQWWEIGWIAELALWNEMIAPFCPFRSDRSGIDPKDQLVIPEPLAEDDEHGLFA